MMAKPTTIIGIDCAVDPKNVGLAMGSWDGGQCALAEGARVKTYDSLCDTVTGWINQSNAPVLLAMDAPLSWPSDLGKQLARHRAGEPLTGDANEFFRRFADREIKPRLGKQPLDVGADRIARTAHAALRLLEGLRKKTGYEIPLAWTPRDLADVSAIEVYPAGTLNAHGIDATGYKNKTAGSKRLEIIEEFKGMIEMPEPLIPALAESDDALDALLCIVAGTYFLNGKAMRPSEDMKTIAEKEGWIWV